MASPEPANPWPRLKAVLKAQDWRLVGAILGLAALVVGALHWRRDILQAEINPKAPFQVYQPPPAPDYARPAAWALIPAQPDHWTTAEPPADVFFISPTSFDGGRDWNAPTDEPRANRFLALSILPNYAGPFRAVGRLFAPRYRQASLYAELALNDDARGARQFAYGDVKRAFDQFIDHDNDGRPVIIAGVEQGGFLAQRLVREELAQRPDLGARLAAVYLIDVVAPADKYGPSAPLTACARPGEPRCVVGWIQALPSGGDDGKHRLARALVWGPNNTVVDLAGRPSLCVNPVLGAATSARAPARLNLGGAVATGRAWGSQPTILRRQVAAQCVDGVLLVSNPASAAFKITGGWLERMKEPGYNLFYADLEADARARVRGLVGRADFRQTAPPLDAAVEVRRSPIHRAQ